MNQQEAELRQQRIQINQAEMIERISRAVPEDGLSEVFPGVVLGRFSKPTEAGVFRFQAFLLHHRAG